VHSAYFLPLDRHDLGSGLDDGSRLLADFAQRGDHIVAVFRTRSVTWSTPMRFCPWRNG
jgi:hypothetical protein